MADLNGGDERPKIYDRASVEQWLDALPPDRRRQAAVVIAARAALRILPLIERSAPESQARQFGRLALAVFWATALARVAIKYPTRANDLRSAAAADAAAAAARAAYAPSRIAAYAAARAADAAAARAADARAADAAARAADTAAAIWSSTFADIAALEAGCSPSDLAGDPLWPHGAPTWTMERWRLVRELLAEPHWRPWLDWYERRLDGVELYEEIELLFATLPVDPLEKDPAEQNLLLAQEIARLTTPSPPALPQQGAGPHVEIDPETGVIVPAKPESLDSEGNHVARLRALHPQVARLARELAASVSANEQPELHGSTSRYVDNADRDLAEIDFDQLWGEGVFLEARAAAAAKGASDGMREPLSAATLATLNALLEVHGPFILSSRAGLENLALSREFHRRPEEARDEEAATRELARAFETAPEIVSQETAELFAHVVEQPESSVHPERSGAFKAGMKQNIAIVLLAGAGLRVMRLVVGDDASKPFKESLEASEPYKEYLKAAGLLKDKLDRSTEVDLTTIPLDLYKNFVLRHESLLRRALGGRDRARWLHEHLDWLKRETDNRR